MANKKYKLANNDYWATDGVYDFGQSKTQRQINSDVATHLSGLDDDVSDLNGAIGDEATARQNADTALQTTDTAIENGIAIVANGNTHAAIAKGQYVYIKGHGTLAEGLYKATAAVPLNGTLSNTNVATVPNGGLNDFKAFSRSDTIVPLISGGTVNENGCTKTGNIVNITFRHSGISTDAGTKAWATLPVGYRPSSTMALFGYLVANGTFYPVRWTVATDGGLWMGFSSSQTCSQICVAGSFPIQE